MHNEKRKLLDEALSHEAIKNTFRLSWEFMVLNRKFTLTAMSMLLLINILSPFLGLLSMLLSGVFLMAIQLYIAKSIYGAKSMGEFVAQTQKAKIEKAVEENLLVAFGAYLGETVLLFLFLFLFSMLIQTLGFELEKVKKVEDLVVILKAVAFPLMILLLYVSYMRPLVLAKISMATSLQEGFRAMLTLFSFSLWRSTLGTGYFYYMSRLLVLIFMGATFLGILLTIPFMSFLAGFIIIAMLYIYSVIFSISAMMGRRVVELSEG